MLPLTCIVLILVSHVANIILLQERWESEVCEFEDEPAVDDTVRGAQAAVLVHSRTVNVLQALHDNAKY